MIGYIVFFIPPGLTLAYCFWLLVKDREYIVKSEGAAWLVALVVPLYPFFTLIVLMNSYRDEGRGMLVVVASSVVYYPITTVILFIYALYFKYTGRACFGLFLCFIPAVIVLFGGSGGVSPH